MNVLDPRVPSDPERENFTSDFSFEDCFFDPRYRRYHFNYPPFHSSQIVKFLRNFLFIVPNLL